jgi:hypothetical protein
LSLAERLEAVTAWRNERKRLASVVVAQRVVEEQWAAPPPVPDLDDHESFAEYAWFGSETDVGPDGPTPVRGITPIQAEYDRHRAAFRVDEHGRPIPGLDIVLKPRRAKLTSHIFRRIMHAAIKLGGLRIITILHTQTPDVMESAIQQALYTLERFPPGWVTVQRRGRGPWVPLADADVGDLRRGATLRFCRCRWDFTTAGDRPATARKRGRSGAAQILHLTEAREFRAGDDLWTALRPLARMWVICETNPPSDRTAWVAQEYIHTRDGVGAFTKPHLFAWHQDPDNRIRRGSAEYAKVMRHDFPLGERDAAREAELRLDDEQIAFRRDRLCTGSTVGRQLMRAEYPETLDDCFVVAGQRFLDADAVDACEALCPPPIRAPERYGAGLWLTLWVDPETYLREERRVVVGVDTAELYGRDHTAMVFRDPHTLEYVAELHGVASWGDCAGALRDVLEMLVGFNPNRYVLGIERNHGLGLIAECESPRYRLRVYHETIVGSDGARSSRAGIHTGQWNRRRYMDLVTTAVEGPAFDEDGNPRKLGPTVPFASKRHVQELRDMVVVAEKPQSAEGKHEDTVIADAICLALCHGAARAASVAMSTRTGSASAPSRAQATALGQSRAQRRMLARGARRR